MEVYRRALVEGGLPRADVPDCLSRLHLVTEGPDSPGFMVPSTPESASFATLSPIEEAIERERGNLSSTRATLSLFDRLYAEVHRFDQPPLTLLAGRAAIKEAIDAAVDGCAEELLTMQPGGGRPERALGDSLSPVMQALARGVRQRTLYQHAVRSHRATLSYIERVTAAGAEVRTLAEVVDRVIICDRTTAFIPYSDEKNDALLVQHPSVVRFLIRNFENAWARSVPVRPAGEPLRTPVITSDLQRTILLAVVSGETDDSIARRVGMSRRSVAEHMRKVSERLGSTSRAQLGYLLATSGMLDEP
jgi:DNA-binding NarL/FixJ family response regulator